MRDNERATRNEVPVTTIDLNHRRQFFETSSIHLVGVQRQSKGVHEIGGDSITISQTCIETSVDRIQGVLLKSEPTMPSDEFEVYFRNAFFINHTRDIRRQCPPIPDGLPEVVALGGNSGWLKKMVVGSKQQFSADAVKPTALA